jgi:hypothetical protein
MALNCNHLPEDDVFHLVDDQGRSPTVTRGFSGDVIGEALKRARERWPADRVYEKFISSLVCAAPPSQLRAVVSAAMSGGYKHKIDLIFLYGRLNDLSSADLLALLHEGLDHGHGELLNTLTMSDSFKQIAVCDVLGVLQRLAATPAPANWREDFYSVRPCLPQAAHFTKEEVLQLATAAISHGHDGFASSLLELPVLQSLEKQELYLLLQTAALHETSRVVFKLVNLPLFEQIDVTLLLNLLKQLAQKPSAPANERNGLLDLIAFLSHSTVQYGQLVKAAMRSGEAVVFSAMTKVKLLVPLPDLGDYLKEAIADGHELAACNLLRSPEAGKLPRALLQQLHNMAVEKGQVGVQHGLAYLLHLQQLEASLDS